MHVNSILKYFNLLINFSFAQIKVHYCNVFNGIREFKLHVSGNGKRQVRNFLTKFSLNVFVSYFLSCVERIIMYFSFKTASSFTLYRLIYRKIFLCLAFAV